MIYRSGRRPLEAEGMQRARGHPGSKAAPRLRSWTITHHGASLQVFLSGGDLGGVVAGLKCILRLPNGLIFTREKIRSYLEAPGSRHLEKKNTPPKSMFALLRASLRGHWKQFCPSTAVQSPAALGQPGCLSCPESTGCYS